MAYNVLGLVCR